MVIDNKLRAIVSSIDLSHETIRMVREKTLIFLQKKIRPGEQLENLNLVMSEFFTNVIKHSAEATQISVLTSDSPPVLVLEDDGTSIDHLLDVAPSMDELTLEDALHESGMGLSLIKSLFPDSRYEPKDTEAGSIMNRLWIPLLFSQKLTVAVIDDDLSQLGLLEAYLESDYNVILFSDPLEALERLPHLHCDLIVCDIRMPQMSGLRLREKVLTIGAMRLTPFIFLSGAGEADIQRTAAHLSIDDFVQKPVKKNTLINTISRILKRSQDVRESHDAALDKALTHSLWNQIPATLGPYQCDTSYQVATRGGGDFIFVEKRDQSTLIVLGDMMGHGEQAKFFSFALSGYLHGLCLALAENGSVGHLLAVLSGRIQSSQVLANTLVTMLVMEVFENGRIEIASGGHPPPILIDALGNIAEVEVGGMLPGLADSPEYHVATLFLSPGQSLLAYTDGLIEGGLTAVTEHEELAALSTLINSTRLQSNTRPATALLESLKLDATKELSDDLTIIIITAPQ